MRRRLTAGTGVVLLRKPLVKNFECVGNRVMPLRAGWFVYAALDLGHGPGAKRRPARPAEAVFTRVECIACICSIIALVYVVLTGLFRAWQGDQAVSCWYLALTIISNTSLLAPVDVCHCAICYTDIATGEEESKVHEEDSPPEGPPVGLRGGAWI